MSLPHVTPIDQHMEVKTRFLCGLYRDSIIPPIFLQHANLHTAKSVLGKKYLTCKKIACVRNPYSRLYSAYLYNEARRGGSFEEFVLKDDGLKARIDRSVKKGHTTSHFGHQYRYLYLDGRFEVDYVIRFENLSRSIAALASWLGYPVGYNQQERFQKTGASGKFREMYTEEMKDVVWRLYEEDFRLLGYEP